MIVASWRSLSLRVDRDDDYQNAVAHAAAIDQRGVCIRLLAPNLDNDIRLAVRLESLLHRQLAVEPEEVNLLVDLQGFQPDRIGIQLRAVRSAISALPFVSRWRSLVLAQSTFPATLSMITRDTTANLSRAEWTLWRELWEERAELPRLPTFADYAAEAPGFFQGHFVDPTAVIRYTIDDAWLILRGHNPIGGRRSRPVPSARPPAHCPPAVPWSRLQRWRQIHL